MKYVENHTVRWHDTDARREMRPSALLALMQETSNMQFAASGHSLDAIRDKECVGFIVSRLSFDILRPLAAFEKIRVETFTCKGHGYTFPRGFEVFCGEELIARCHSLWALVRVGDRALVSCEAFPLSFGDEPELSTEMPVRFRVPRDLAFEVVGERRITFADLDYNMHMNNTKYPDMVCDFLPDPANLRVVGMSLAYYREAAFGDTLTVYRAESENGYLFRLVNQDGKTCMEAELYLENM